MVALLVWIVLSVGGATFAAWAVFDAALDLRLVTALGISDMRLAVARRNVRTQASRLILLLLWTGIGIGAAIKVPSGAIQWGLVAGAGIVTADSIADRLSLQKALEGLPRSDR